MDRCDFSSIMTILRSYVRENNQLNQSEFLYEVFEDFMDSPESKDFSFDEVCHEADLRMYADKKRLKADESTEITE